MQLLTHTIFGKVGPIGAFYGYLHCPAKWDGSGTGFKPCIEMREEYDDGDYRYRRIGPEWFIVEIFQRHSSIN